MADVESKDKVPIKPAIIMKVDGPTEDCNNTKQENVINKIRKNEEFKICSPSNPIRISSTNAFASENNRFGKSILKPSQLSLNSSSPSSSNFVLKQSIFNPFNKSSDNSKTVDNSDKNKANGELLKFVPLIKSDSQRKQQTETKQSNNTTTAAFVFGQNLQDRILSGENKVGEPKPSTSLSSNGTSDMLFSSAIKTEGKVEALREKEPKSLTESAREYEESRANKRKYDEVQVKTGEEEETNILSTSCKLFSFDKATSNWQERGRGTLRLNDFEIDESRTGSRLVFRTAGSLRVILNTKIWAEMTIDKASDKSIRLTALDANGEVRVFLLMSSIEDSRQLYLHLQTRLEKEITLQKRKKIESNNSGEH